ncbi:hypothetical protein MPTK1_5g04130 [Marchantia polymorpha subsp. ruderalis]|uniref:Uncharacterized protein n=2 Tax=Marchantia polymorpha TaxID=3197 RepID=A0AAF6BES7_MARPO|nr:hypothetical protein MARPO_0141s0020 [Marchantia polymorpha]BBN10511.1 hypothetical protein Mp_5g04130 [Marchantia polymorpha subsp. ruderalis]|eukprot:PTQ29440.1 hypothetical protein MARPO_0141s0020 [Marchantia polymorpha]
MPLWTSQSIVGSGALLSRPRTFASRWTHINLFRPPEIQGQKGLRDTLNLGGEESKVWLGYPQDSRWRAPTPTSHEKSNPSEIFFSPQSSAGSNFPRRKQVLTS